MIHLLIRSLDINAKPPEPVKRGADAAVNWKLWKQLWSSYAVVADLQNDRIDDITRKMDAHISEQTNETFETYKSNTRAQHREESTDTYVAE